MQKSIKLFITPGGKGEFIGKGDRKEYFNSLSQIGGSLSQVTELPEMMHSAEDLPMSRYLEAKNNECYILNKHLILFKLLLTRDYNLGEFRRTISICQSTIAFPTFVSLFEH